MSDILKIDNLYEFQNLKQLQLDNNIIEKIENLGFLKNLTWLDLSFNNIVTIEGLDQLVNFAYNRIFAPTTSHNEIKTPRNPGKVEHP